MDLRKLKTILELFEASKVAELEISEGEERLRLCKHSPRESASPGIAASAPPPETPATPPAVAAAESPENGNKVASPMVGTFYRAVSPESPPFVRIGQTVEVGQTLCIIEAMKLMNEIPSPAAGKITRILIENGAAVGYGEPMFVIE